jgi:hypothetical protein
MMGYVVGGVLLTLGLEILIRWSQRGGAWRKAGQGHTARAQVEEGKRERS